MATRFCKFREPWLYMLIIMPECIDDKGLQSHPHFSIEIEKNGSGLGKKKKINFGIVSGYIIFVPIIFSCFLPIIWFPNLLILEFQFPHASLNCIYKWLIIKLCLESMSESLIFSCWCWLHLSCIFVWHNIHIIFSSSFPRNLAYEGSFLQLRWLGTLQIFN